MARLSGRLACALALPLLLAACAGNGGMAGESHELKTLSDQTAAEKRAQIRLQLAVGYYQERKYEIALDEVKQAIAADPDDADAYGVRALIYTAMNENRLADENYRHALRLAPRNPDLSNNYGLFLCDAGGKPGAGVVHRQHDGRHGELGVEVRTHHVDRGEQLAEALEGVVLRLDRDEHLGTRDERVQGEQAERRRAVDEDVVEAVLADLGGGADPRVGVERLLQPLLASDDALSDLRRITEIGVDLILDDFGTGYSALSSVLQSPVAGLKLAREFTLAETPTSLQAACAAARADSGTEAPFVEPGTIGLVVAAVAVGAAVVLWRRRR